MRLEPAPSHVARIASTLLGVEPPAHVNAALDRIAAAEATVAAEEALVGAWLDELTGALRALGSSS